jgi:hypothetical protein
MEIDINLGFVTASVDLDLESAVEEAVGDIDWEFLDDLIDHRLSHGSRLDDAVSDAIANSSTTVNGPDIASDLLGQYVDNNAANGNADHTSCPLAQRFEKAVFQANSRLAGSRRGSGAIHTPLTMDDATMVRERLSRIERELGELRAIVRALAMSDSSHARNTDHLTGSLPDRNLSEPIHPPTTNPDRDQEQASILG